MDELKQNDTQIIEQKKKLDIEALAHLRKTKAIKVTSILISFLLVIGLINGVWWIYLKLSGYNNITMPVATPLTMGTPTPTPIPEIDKSQWSELEIAQVGVKLKHPSDWNVTELTGAILDVYKITPSSRTIGLQISVWLASGFSEPSQDVFRDGSKIKINNIEMESVSLAADGNFREAYRFKSVNDKYIVVAEINGGNDQDYFHVLRETVKTFSSGELADFPEATLAPDLPAIGWKRIESVRFKIDIPSNWKFNQVNNGYEISNNLVPDSVFWSVKEYEINQTNKGEVIAQIGEEYIPEREELRSIITDWNYPAEQIIVTSISEPLFYSDNIIINSSDNLRFFVISSEGNKETRFTNFWRSFKLK